MSTNASFSHPQNDKEKGLENQMAGVAQNYKVTVVEILNSR